MPLPSGTRIGSYEVVDLLGQGGMGEVYRARDHKLGRDVALKVINSLVADDPDRLARFRREAQVLASLNHPNIAHIYGLEDADATGPALVLELVEGATLADRIAAGPVPVNEALAIARQIADALAFAHECGIVHRDLKPANIKLKGAWGATPTRLPDGRLEPALSATGVAGSDVGTVKILDFGLAKALTDPASQYPGSKDPGLHPSLANSPTLTARGTEIGLILGTAAYMSPEQARGKPVDRRADIWAFGVVLYEMLTGRRAFEGPEISDVLASVLKDTPPLDALPADTPPPVRRLLRRALEKDPSRRLDSMSVARLELDDVQDAAVVMRDAPASPRRMFIPVAIAAILSGLAVGAAMRFTSDAPPAPAIVRLSMTPTPDQPIGLEANHADIAISPDGSRLVYLSENSQGRWFTVRPLDRGEGAVLSKIGEHPRGVFISHDGRWIAYQAGAAPGRSNELRKVPIDGGPPLTICPITSNMRGGSWAADDTIVFATINPQTGLMRVAAAGGTPEVLTTPAEADGELDHLWPQHLPDGRHVLFTISREDGTWDVALLSLETKTWRVLVKDGLSPRYASSGHLLYVTGNGIRAVPFDLQTLAIKGTPIDVIPDVVTKESGAADYAVSASGTLVYLPGGATDNAQALGWREPDGTDTPLSRVTPLNYQSLRLSPEGRRAIALVNRRAGTPSAVWLIDLVRETAIRLTPPELPVNVAVWHPDGQQIVFSTWSGTLPVESRGLFTISASGTGVPKPLLLTRTALVPFSWTPNGSHLFVTSGPGSGNADIGRVAFASPTEVEMLIAGPTPETAPALSPNGRWLAYVTNDNGLEVFVRPYPDVNAARIPASNGFGMTPVWSGDGRQLYFSALNSELHVMDVEETSTTIAFGKPRLVMHTRDELNDQIRFALPPVNGRILRTVRATSALERPTEYRVVLNWTEELKARAAGR